MRLAIWSGARKAFGKDFFLGEVGDLEGTLALVRIPVAIPGLGFIESTHLPGVGRFGGHEGTVEGAGFEEAFSLGSAVDTNDIHEFAPRSPRGDRAGAVQLIDELDEVRRDFAMGLVADGPDNDRGMVAITKDPLLEVATPPVFKVESAVILRSFFAPSVKDFVHHENAELVAEIVEEVLVGIVGGADGVAAHGLEFAQFPLEQLGGPGSSDRTAGEVFADSTEFGDLAIEMKAGVFVPLNGADAEGDGVGVDLLAVFGESKMGGVKGGRVGVPELRAGDGKLDGLVFLWGGVGGGDDFFIGVLNLNFQLEEREVFDLGLDGDGRFGGGNLGSGDEGGVVDEVVLEIGCDEFNGGVDAARVIPAGGGFFGAVDADFDGV